MLLLCFFRGHTLGENILYYILIRVVKGFFGIFMLTEIIPSLNSQILHFSPDLRPSYKDSYQKLADYGLVKKRKGLQMKSDCKKIMSTRLVVMKNKLKR